MSQRGNDDKQAPEIRIKTIGEKFNDGTEKIKSLYSFARIYKVSEDLRKLNECAYVPRLIAIGPLHQKAEHLQKPMQDVKEDLRKLNECAYVPRLIAIGPLHQKAEHLQKPMQDVKMDYANRLFLRLTKGIADSKIRVEKKDELIQECVEKMKKFTVKAKKYDAEEEGTLVDMAKKCYAEELDLSDDEMMEMMLVDGCFILELLYVYYHTNYCQVRKDSSSIPQPINGGKGGSKSNRRGCEQPRADPICDSILTANIVKHDLMLLENQIPFFVLECLFELTVAKIPVGQTMGCPPKLLLEDYVRSYFSEFLSLEGGQSSDTQLKTSCCSASDHCILSVCGPKEEIKHGETESGKANDYHHILHLIHSSYIPGKETELGIELDSTKHCELTLSASDLHYAGVKFEPTTDLHEVKFINKGIGCWQCRTLAFRIPTISIRKTTESFLRNVIALEQCSTRVPQYFTSYAKLMDMFINSEEDVRVLKNDKVIHNYLSTDKDVRDLFNNLCKEVVLDDFHFDMDCREASEFNMRWRTRAVRYVTRLFVASPWPALAFFMGIAAFAIAVYQFGYKIRAQVRHDN